jgi:Flp pilus assembly protein TadG
MTENRRLLDWPARWTRFHAEDDRGVALITITLFLVVLLIVAAIIIDLGTAYTSSRQTQNASDSAAMAGAQAVYKSKVSLGAANERLVLTQVNNALAANNAVLVSCQYLDLSQTAFGACADTAPPATAVGVLVTSSRTNATFFGNVVNVNNITVSRPAAATAQPVINGLDGPFIVCGTRSNGNNLVTYPPNGGPAFFDTTKASFYAVGTANYLTLEHNNDPDTSCGFGPPLDGHGNGAPFVYDATRKVFIGGGGPGNGLGNVPSYTNQFSNVSNACPPSGPPKNGPGCNEVLPVAELQCSGAVPSPPDCVPPFNPQPACPPGGFNPCKAAMPIVAFAIFEVTQHNGNPKYFGQYVGLAVTVPIPQTSNGVCSFGVPCAVKLIQ